MIKNKKIMGAAAVAIGVAGIATFLSVAGGKAPGSASLQSCAVYSAFYDSLGNSKATFLAPHAVGFPKKPSRDAPSRTAPTRFEGETGEIEKVVLFQGAEPVERKVKRAFRAQVSDYFEPLWSHAPANIKPCFKSKKPRPDFHKGRYKPLLMREKLLRRDANGMVTVWRLSPVGFSDDENRALLYAEYYCGGACGGGSYFLFEQKDGAWVRIGEHRAWFS